MKVLIVITSFLFVFQGVIAQSDFSSNAIADSGKAKIQLYKVIKTDGGELVGEIISQDSREVFFKTNDGREFYIPQHSIKEIVKLDAKEFNKKGNFIGEETFATRYFISTNGLPIKKGDSYVLWNWYGPDVQFGLADNFGVGLITTWFGAPAIGTIKKSFEINDHTQCAVGGLFGSGSWGNFDAYGALPFGLISFGDRNRNIAFSGGYGLVSNEGNSDTGILTSVAGMTKVTERVSFVCETFFIIPQAQNSTPIALLFPGLRIHQAEGKAIQFGISGIFIDGESFGLPMFQWYRAF